MNKFNVVEETRTPDYREQVKEIQKQASATVGFDPDRLEKEIGADSKQTADNQEKK